MEDNKIFVFLSHSHHDYEKVRLVRDLLEKEGFRPLMFFLKCLEKDGYEELTRTLIKEEIDSRQRFILCKSKNTEGSSWVKFEVDHIKSKNRPYEVVDLDSPQIKIEEAVSRFKKRSTVFLSFSRRQVSLAEKVDRQLKLHDFNTFSVFDSLSPGNNYVSAIVDQMRIAAENGYLLFFMSEYSSNSKWQMRELDYAIQKYNNRIIPVNTIPINNMSDMIQFLCADLNWIDVSDKQETEAAEYIVQRLLEIDMKQYQSE